MGANYLVINSVLILVQRLTVQSPSIVLRMNLVIEDILENYKLY
jgi:hypothetical protein